MNNLKLERYTMKQVFKTKLAIKLKYLVPTELSVDFWGSRDSEMIIECVLWVKRALNRVSQPCAFQIMTDLLWGSMGKINFERIENSFWVEENADLLKYIWCSNSKK